MYRYYLLFFIAMHACSGVKSLTAFGITKDALDNTISVTGENGAATRLTIAIWDYNRPSSLLKIDM